VIRAAKAFGTDPVHTSCQNTSTAAQVNSLMAADDLGKPWLSVKNFLVATWGRFPVLVADGLVYQESLDIL
jgi:hypothetical protein